MTTQNENNRYERGLARLKEIHGQAGVDAVMPLGDVGRYIVEFAFGDIYSREGLDLRQRQMITVAILTALGGREAQLRVHMHSTLNLGVTPDEIREIILQTIPYAGFPTAMNAMNLLNSVLSEVDQ